MASSTSTSWATTTFVGSVTTTFSAPSWCSTLVINTELDEVARDVSCDSDGYAEFATDCFPGSFSAFVPVLAYSPAIACPSGWDIQNPRQEAGGQKVMGCCPSGYDAAYGEESCVSTLYPEPTGGTDVYSCSGTELVSYTKTTSWDGIWGVQIQLYLEDSLSTTFDSQTATALDVSKTKSGHASSRPTGTSGPNSADSSPDDNKGSGGISSGAIAGIVIGIVAVIALLGGLLFLLHRRKQAQKKGPVKSDSDTLPEFVGTTSHSYGPVPPKSPTEVTTEGPTGLFQPQPTGGPTR